MTSTPPTGSHYYGTTVHCTHRLVILDSLEFLCTDANEMCTMRIIRFSSILSNLLSSSCVEMQIRIIQHDCSVTVHYSPAHSRTTVYSTHQLVLFDLLQFFSDLLHTAPYCESYHCTYVLQQSVLGPLLFFPAFAPAPSV